MAPVQELRRDNRPIARILTRIDGHVLGKSESALARQSSYFGALRLGVKHKARGSRSEIEAAHGAPKEEGQQHGGAGHHQWVESKRQDEADHRHADRENAQGRRAAPKSSAKPTCANDRRKRARGCKGEVRRQRKFAADAERNARHGCDQRSLQQASHQRMRAQHVLPSSIGGRFIRHRSDVGARAKVAGCACQDHCAHGLVALELQHDVSQL